MVAKPGFCLQCYTSKQVVENGVCSSCSYYNDNPFAVNEMAGDNEAKGIVPQLQTKLTTYLTHRKSSLTHEIQLIKEALHD